MTGEIINNGMNSFEPIVDKLGDITTEFVPYLIHIALILIWICCSIYIVKYILNYMKQQSINAWREKRERRYERYARYRREKTRKELIEYRKHGIRTKGMDQERKEMWFWKL